MLLTRFALSREKFKTMQEIGKIPIDLSLHHYRQTSGKIKTFLVDYKLDKTFTEHANKKIKLL